MLLYDNFYMMMRCHEDTVMLRSITGPYGWTCDWGHIWGDFDSLYWGCCSWCLAQEKWLGCRHDSSPMVDIPGSTPVCADYMYFRLFNIKTYMYYVLKIYMYYEKDTGGSWRCFDPTMFIECFRPPTMFSLK